MHRRDRGVLDRLAMELLRLVSCSRLGLQIIYDLNLVSELKQIIRNSQSTKFQDVCGDLVSHIGLC